MHTQHKNSTNNFESYENNSDNWKLEMSKEQKGFEYEQFGKLFGNLRGVRIHTAKAHHDMQVKAIATNIILMK